MGYSVYMNGKRYAGYGVPAYCDHPDCNEEIDRGISYACGGEPFSEVGCDGYFCSKHRKSGYWDKENGEWCKHEDDCECEWNEYCERCLNNKQPFEHKPEHPEWVYHLLNHYSWETWRKNNPEEVEELKKLPSTKPEHWDNEDDND